MYIPEQERIPVMQNLDEKARQRIRMVLEAHAPARPSSFREEEEKQRQQKARLRLEQELQRRKYEDMYYNSIPYFMKECDALRFDPKEKTPSALLYEVYCRWCQENKLFPESIRSFGLHLKGNAHKYQIAPTNFTWQGRHMRGYRGIAVMEEAHT